MATANITEFSAIAAVGRNHFAQSGKFNAETASQNVIFSTSAQSDPLGEHAVLVRIVVDVNARLVIGRTPQTAGNNDTLLIANVPEYFGVTGGDVVAVVAD